VERPIVRAAIPSKIALKPGILRPKKLKVVKVICVEMGSHPCHHTKKSSRMSAKPRLAIRDATKLEDTERFRNGATMIRCKSDPNPRKIGVVRAQNVHGEKGYRSSAFL
jgi:hypothetical protein